MAQNTLIEPLIVLECGLTTKVFTRVLSKSARPSFAWPVLAGRQLISSSGTHSYIGPLEAVVYMIPLGLLNFTS